MVLITVYQELPNLLDCSNSENLSFNTFDYGFRAVRRTPRTWLHFMNKELEEKMGAEDLEVKKRQFFPHIAVAHPMDQPSDKDETVRPNVSDTQLTETPMTRISFPDYYPQYAHQHYVRCTVNESSDTCKHCPPPMTQCTAVHVPVVCTRDSYSNFTPRTCAVSTIVRRYPSYEHDFVPSESSAFVEVRKSTAPSSPTYPNLRDHRVRSVDTDISEDEHVDPADLIFPRNRKGSEERQLNGGSTYHEEPASPTIPFTRQRNERNIQLFKFLIEILEDKNQEQCAVWIDRANGVFRITDSTRFAKRWGEIKLNPTMNYEKLARSFRHYYRKGILEGYSGGSGNGKRKLLYKFSKSVMDQYVFQCLGSFAAMR